MNHYPFSLRKRVLIFILPLFCIVFFFALYAKFPKVYLSLIIEDGLVEYLQALCYLAASVIGSITAYRLSKESSKINSVVVLVFSIGSMLIFAEEVSWGQRIIGFSTPEVIQQINTQKEFTAHNLFFIQRYTAYAYFAICGYACIAWLVFAFSFFRRINLLRYMVPGWETITMFAPIAVFYYLHILYFNLNQIPVTERYFIWPEVESWHHQEALELLFAVGFVVVGLRNLYLSRSEKMLVDNESRTF